MHDYFNLDSLLVKQLKEQGPLTFFSYICENSHC